MPSLGPVEIIVTGDFAIFCRLSARTLLLGAGWLCGSLGAAPSARADEPTAVLAPSEAVEQPPGLELSVAHAEGTGDCPDRAPLLRAALARGTSPVLVDGSRPELLLIQVVYQRDGTTYLAEISATGRKTGVRHLRAGGDTCDSLADAASLAVAILLDRVAVDDAPPPPASSKPSPPAKASEPARPASPPPPVFARVLLALRVGATYGLPGKQASAVFGAAARVRWGPWELGAGAFGSPSERLVFAPASVFVSLLAPDMRGCYFLLAGRLEGGPCAGAVFGLLRGEGRGYDQDRWTTQLWPLAQLGLAARWSLSARLAVRLDLTGTAALRQVRFVIAGRGVAFETSPFGFFGEVGPEVRIW